MEISPTNTQHNPTIISDQERTEMQKIAIAFEANFLAEMLKFGGQGDSRETFGGGVGEDAFSGFLVREQATTMAKGGGIGLAAHIVESLIRSAQND